MWQFYYSGRPVNGCCWMIYNLAVGCVGECFRSVIISRVHKLRGDKRPMRNGCDYNSLLKKFFIRLKEIKRHPPKIAGAGRLTARKYVPLGRLKQHKLPAKPDHTESTPSYSSIFLLHLRPLSLPMPSVPADKQIYLVDPLAIMFKHTEYDSMYFRALPLFKGK